MGYLHVYTGDGKGKTTCAVGLAVRAAGAGMNVAFCQFDKGFEGNDEHYHERFVLRRLPEVELFLFGEERIMPTGKFRFANTEADFEQARRGLAKAAELIRGRKHKLVILDEAVACVSTKLITPESLLELVATFRSEGDCELILTGRGAWDSLIEEADLVSEIRLVKHYFYKGVPAREGIEF